MAIPIATERCRVRKRYSIAEARDQLPGIVHEVEQGAPVELTRRGKPVAVIVSIDEFDRLASKRRGFGEALEEFRRTADLEALWEDGDPFDSTDCCGRG